MSETGICGWLSRDGKFYECGESKHNLLASRLEKELGLEMFDQEKSIYLHDTALLETLGFIKFTQSTYGLVGDNMTINLCYSLEKDFLMNSENGWKKIY